MSHNLLTELPDKVPAGCKKARSYETRGWFALMAARTLYCLLCVPPLLTVTCTPVLSPRRTMFERCSAELAKSFKLQKAKWKLVIDIADKGGGAQRRLPTTPERFAKVLIDNQPDLLEEASHLLQPLRARVISNIFCARTF